MWDQAPQFSERERAAFAWSDAVTAIRSDVSDGVFERARQCFTEQELVDLTLVIVATHAWN